MTGIYKVWSSVPTKEEEAAGFACFQLIFDMVPLNNTLHSRVLLGLNHSKPATQAATLKGLVEAVERLGSDLADPLSSDAMITTLIKLMDANSGVVRGATPAALQALYRFSPKVKERVLASKLRRDQQDILKKMFATADEEGEIVGRKSKAYEASLQINEFDGAGSGLASSSSHSSLHDSSSTVGSSISGNLSSSSSISISKSASSTNLTAGVKVIPIESEEELKRELMGMSVQFAKLGPNAWQERVTLLKRFQGLVLGGASKLRNFMDLMVPTYITVFKALLPMPRAQISDETTKSLSILAQTAGTSVSSFFDKLIKTIIDKLHSTNAIVSDQGEQCIANILRFSLPNIGALLSDRAHTSQHVSTRSKCILFVQQLIQEGSSEHVDRWIESFFIAIKAGVVDSNEGVRSNARRAFASFHRRWPERGLRLWDVLDAGAKSTMKKEGIAPQDDGIISHERSSSRSGLSTSGSSGNLGAALGSSSSSLSSSSHSKLSESHSYESNGNTHISEKEPATSTHTATRTAPNTMASSSSAMAPKRTASSASLSSMTSTSTTATRNRPITGASSAATSGTATRVMASSAPKASSAQRVTRPPVSASNTSNTHLETAQTPRKIISSSTLASSAKKPPSSISKAHSAGGLTSNSATASSSASSSTSSKDMGETASTTSVTSFESEEKWETPVYVTSSSDTATFRSIFKRCGLANTEERAEAMHTLREMVWSDELLTLWSSDLLRPLAECLVLRLLDSQLGIVQDALDIIKLMRYEHPAALDPHLEILTPSLIVVAWSATSKPQHHASAMATICHFAQAPQFRLIGAALKAIERPDPKLKLQAIKTLSAVFLALPSLCWPYFTSNSKRFSHFISWLAIKPGNFGASLDMSRAIIECFGHLYSHFGESFAAALRLSKFTGIDSVYKKLKIPLTAPKVAPPKASAPVTTKRTTSATSTMSTKKTSTFASAVKVPSKATASTSSNAEVSVPPPATSRAEVPSSAAKTARPTLQRQTSLTTLPSAARSRLLMSLEEANAAHARDMIEAAEASSTENVAARPLLPPLTPSADKVRAMRQEIAATPNVLATVMAHPTIISPLTPSLRNGTPTFGARGRSTSTPQMRSITMSGREESSPAAGHSPFSPIKFKLDCNEDRDQNNGLGASSSSHSSAVGGAGSSRSHSPLPQAPPATPLQPLVLKIDAHLGAEEWELARTTLVSMTSTLGEVSTDQLLTAIHHEQLLDTLRRCLDRNIPVAPVRHAACKLLTNVKHKLPARDWDPLFATLPPNQQKLILKFIESIASK